MWKKAMVWCSNMTPAYFLIAVTISGLCLMFFYLIDYRPLLNLDTLIFAAVTALANALCVVFPRSGIFLSLSYPVLMCMMLVKGPASVMWVSLFVLILFIPRLGVERMIYNLAQLALVVSITGLLIPGTPRLIILSWDFIWVLVGAVAGDVLNIFLISKYVCYRQKRDFKDSFREMWTKKLCLIRPVVYAIGILMTVHYQSQGILAAVFAFLPGVGIFCLLNSDVALEAKTMLTKTDNLTQVGNRYALSCWWEREFSSLQQPSLKMSVLMIDIDDFKRINDTLGHQAGDEVLREVSRTIQASLRQGDRIFRYGGEEFVIVLPGVDVAMARDVAVRICENVAKLNCPTLAGCGVTVSIGIAGWSEELAKEVDAPIELVRRSDIAMYLAKREGKNRVCVFM